MLPGWPDPGQVPADYLEPLFVHRSGWHRVYLDLPGRGGTRGEPWIQSNDDVLAIILDVIDQIAPDERFAVAGHSAGGYLARAVLSRRFDRVDGLLQVVPVGRVNEAVGALPAQVTVMRDDRVATLLEAEFGPAIAEAFASRLVIQSMATYERLRVLVPKMQNHDSAFLDRLGEREELSFDVDALSAPFPHPALFVLGRQDSVVGYESALGLRDSYTRGTFALVDGAGHALPWEQPDVFNALAQNWLDSMERVSD